jgi:hypothetical protein
MRWLVLLLVAACAAPTTQAEADLNMQRATAAAQVLQSASDGFYRSAETYRAAGATTTCTPGYGGSFSCSSW